MNLQSLLDPEIQKFIIEHQYDDLRLLALKLSSDKNPFGKEILNQVQGRQKAKNKIPDWLQIPNVLFPTGISIEQSSSEATAKYKASLFSGKKLIDLSSGLGVDSFYLSKVFDQVVLVEPNEQLLEIVKHNFQSAGIKNASFYNNTAEYFIHHNSPKADLIYIDPSRRSNTNKKLFRLEDCQPNVAELVPELFLIAPKIVIKTAPLLDIQAAIATLSAVKKVFVLAQNNECKEVLYLLEKGFANEPEIETINLIKGKKQVFNFLFSQEKQAISDFSIPLKFLYEPNASVMKSGAFKLIATRFNIQKLSPNSHLYTSQTLINDFPGRSFHIQAVCKYNKKEVHHHLKDKKANVTSRNFKDNVSEIVKKTGIIQGGDKYLFATTNTDKKAVIIICNRI
ncbi:MAG: RsmD family RNA methyltransferase [Bacteroidetes bacterium]|nr:RsmD family RNA methyltransferase [Bacteroidota bacterium]HET6244574.1 RsmD family RNA methyltransferase [Bacteroidia bacterium]